MHEGIVAAFFLDRTEVMLDAYHSCVSKGACVAARTDEPFCNEKLPDHGQHPVNCVDNNDAESYCRFVGARLPTETEWEYAASGGNEERKYSWGAEDPDTKRACYNHPGGSCPVASFAPGAFGLYDMSGNVWEWTSSWFGPYPEELKTGTHKVFKGGSWSRWQPHWLLNRKRSRWEPVQHNAWLGFRCAKSKLPLECPANTEARDDRCVRVSGVPLCEPNAVWNGKVCAVGSASGPPVGDDRAHPGQEPAVGAPGPVDEPVIRSRTPGFDADCHKLYHVLGLGQAYLWSGADFHARAKLIAAGGCRRRDTGARTTSACCAE